METDAAVPVPMALPDDVLTGILGRLLARSLAASRCVCKAWRDLVDDRGLLRQIRHLLPHSASGIFVNYVDHSTTHFFARPTTSPAAVYGDLSYVLPVCYGSYQVADHCTGLVLYRGQGMNAGELCVGNPTTRRGARLPELAGVRKVWERRAYLTFSPAASRHYQVLVAPPELVPRDPRRRRRRNISGPVQDAGDVVEWPPARWAWHVFSSRSGRWRERVFVRDGEAAGVVADLRMDPLRHDCCLAPRWRYAVYRNGALYVHCRGEYVSRLSLSTGNYSYRVIKSPIDRSEHYIDSSEWYNNVRSYLGRSNGDVYFVAINTHRLRIWMLNDHDSQQLNNPAMAGSSEWILKHDRALRPDAWWDLGHGPWILDDYYNWRKQWWRHDSRSFQDYYNRRKERGKLDWSSDGDDDDHDIVCSDEENYGVPETFHFLGFHPYKEVVFLSALYGVVAYHLSTSKVQYLGVFKPDTHTYGLDDSFVYTPCHDLRVTAGEHAYGNQGIYMQHAIYMRACMHVYPDRYSKDVKTTYFLGRLKL